jgi:hypothetical protein
MIQSSAPAAEPRQRQRINLEVTFIADVQTGSGRAVDLSTGGIGIAGASWMLTVGTELDFDVAASELCHAGIAQPARDGLLSFGFSL